MSRSSDFCILVAEDDAILRYAMVETLRRWGYQVIEAADGAQAILIANHHQTQTIHMLISDLRMPHMNGEQLVRELKLSRPELLVLIFTGQTDYIIPPELTGYVLGIIPKPVSLDSLHARVKELLGA